MSKSVCYIKRDNDRLSINAIYKGEDVWDLIEQKINELSGKDILIFKVCGIISRFTNLYF